MAIGADDILYTVVGFLGTLFIMKSVRALRPSSAKNMSVSNTITSTGCSSCRGR